MTGGRETIARLALAVTVRQLPKGHRDRYRREFDAELFDVAPRDRLGYALRLLGRSWSLRSALAPTSLVDDATPTTPLLCRWHRHKWSLQRSPEGDGGYYECLRCAKQKDHNSSIVPPTMGGSWV